MDINQNKIIRSNIQFLVKNFLHTSSLHKDMKNIAIELLHGKGKIFNKNHVGFSWGEFAFHTSSLLDEENGEFNNLKLAASVELLILSTDILDDLVDNDIATETFNILSVPQALILANTLLMESLHLIVKNTNKKSTELFDIVHKNLINAGNGQWQDISFSIDHTFVSENQYFSLIKKKSCSIIQLIFELYNLKYDSTLEEIATYIGYSWQLKNDAQDILSHFKNDLIHKKATLPIIKALEYSNEIDEGILAKQLKLININNPNQELLNEIRNYIKKTGAIDYCIILSTLYINKAKALLKQHFPNNKIQVDNLIQLLD